MRAQAWLPLLLATSLCLQAQSNHLHRFTLANGLQVFHLEAQGHPMIRVWLHQRLVPGDIPPELAGLDALAFRMLEQGGAADLKASEVTRLLEDAGVLFTLSRTPESFTWKLIARNREQDLAMGLLADRVLRPIFDPAVLEAQRLACWEGFLAPAALTDLLHMEPSQRPTETSLGRVGMDDLLAFRARVFQPDRAILILQGDLGLEQAKRLVLLSFGAWRGGASLQGGANRNPTASVGAGPGEPGLLTRFAPGPVLHLEAIAPRPRQVTPETAALLAILLQDEPGLQVTRSELRLSQQADGEGRVTASAVLAGFKARLAALRARTFADGDLAKAKQAWTMGQSLGSLDPEARMAEVLEGALGLAPAADRVATVSPKTLRDGLQAWLAPTQVRLGLAGPMSVVGPLTR